jgi:hypothetical protein
MAYFAHRLVEIDELLFHAIPLSNLRIPIPMLDCNRSLFACKHAQQENNSTINSGVLSFLTA